MRFIDYQKFHDLVASGRTDFSSVDYAAPTPHWALWDSPCKGFDPLEDRKANKSRVTREEKKAEREREAAAAGRPIS